MKRTISKIWKTSQTSKKGQTAIKPFKQFVICDQISLSSHIKCENCSASINQNNRNKFESQQQQGISDDDLLYPLTPTDNKIGNQIEEICNKGKQLPEMFLNINLGCIKIIKQKRLLLKYTKLKEFKFNIIIFGFNNKRICLINGTDSIKCFKMDNIPLYLKNLFQYCRKVITILHKHTNYTQKQQIKQIINPEQVKVVNKMPQKSAHFQYKWKCTKNICQEYYSVSLGITHQQNQTALFYILIKIESQQQFNSFQCTATNIKTVKNFLKSLSFKNQKIRQEIRLICINYWYENIGDI